MACCYLKCAQVTLFLFSSLSILWWYKCCPYVIFCIFLVFYLIWNAEINVPFKKRRSKFAPEMPPAPPDHLLRPLSPITPPLPEDSSLPLHHNPCSSLLPNGLVYSPLLSLPPSHCTTPLQFEVRAKNLHLQTTRLHPLTILFWQCVSVSLMCCNIPVYISPI